MWEWVILKHSFILHIDNRGIYPASWPLKKNEKNPSPSELGWILCDSVTQTFWEFLMANSMDEEPGRLQSTGLQWVQHDFVTKLPTVYGKSAASTWQKFTTFNSYSISVSNVSAACFQSTFCDDGKVLCFSLTKMVAAIHNCLLSFWNEMSATNE